MRRIRRMAAVLVAVLSIAWMTASPVRAADGVSAQLNGFEETPSAIMTTGTGVFLGLINGEQTEIVYQLFYIDLSSSVLFAHIHFGKPGESGGVAAFLCGGGGKPDCPAPGTLLVDTLTADHVVAIAGQNLAAGDLAGLIRAMKSGFTYVNVHTSSFPAGEVRGQIKGPGR